MFPDIYQLTTALGIVGMIVLGTLFGVEKARIADYKHQIAVLSDDINNPTTGYVVKLAQSHANTATETAAIQQQNDVVKAASDASSQRMMEATQALSIQQAQADLTMQKVGTILHVVPTGGTTCARLLDIDKRFTANLRHTGN